MGDDWLGVPGAARYLGVYLRTVYKLIDQGDIPASSSAPGVQPGELARLYPPDHEEQDEE